MSATWLIAGLGNPGSKYLLTRHNIGFMSVDNFALGAGRPPQKEERGNLTHRFKLDDTEVLLAKPQTFMNRSGEPLLDLMQFYKIERDSIVVVHDDIDQAFGAIKIQRNRGSGGHNGLKSITEKLGSMDYIRVKLGVGRPTNPQMDVASYVLQNFDEMEQAELTDFLNVASDAVESILFDGFDKAATRFNRNSYKELAT